MSAVASGPSPFGEQFSNEFQGESVERLASLSFDDLALIATWALAQAKEWEQKKREAGD